MKVGAARRRAKGAFGQLSTLAGLEPRICYQLNQNSEQNIKAAFSFEGKFKHQKLDVTLWCLNQPSLFSINQCFALSTDWTNAKVKTVVLVSEVTHSECLWFKQPSLCLRADRERNISMNSIWLIINNNNNEYRQVCSAQSREEGQFVLFLTIQT